MARNTYILNEELLATTALTADIEGDAVGIDGRPKLGVVVTWSSLTGTLDAEYSLEVSNDGTLWSSLTTPVSVSGASDSDAVISQEAFFTYVRLKVTQNNVTGGNISATISFFQ